MKKNRTKDVFFGLLSLTIFIFILMFVSSGLYASEKFPNKEIKIIVPFGTGGGLDINARVIQPNAQKELGVPLVIVNVTGGAGTVGFLEGARAKPDGYTITGVTPSVIITQYTTDVGMDYKKYEPIIQAAYAPGGLIVKKDSRWNNIEEFLSYAKENPKMITMSTTGPGALWHTIAIAIEEATGAKFTYVPYTSGVEAATAVMGGHVDCTILSMGDVKQFIESEMIKVLAITASERYKFTPDVPTFKEKGYDIDLGVWWGYLVPKGTPKDIVNVLYNAFKKSLESEECIKFINENWIVYREMEPEEFQVFLDQEDVRWRKLITSINS